MFLNAEAIFGQRSKAIAGAVAFQLDMDNMHKNVQDSVGKLRTRAQKLHNAKADVYPINFTVGDYVLIQNPNSKRPKLTRA